jgi:hypothetical protein
MAVLPVAAISFVLTFGVGLWDAASWSVSYKFRKWRPLRLKRNEEV